MTSQRTPMPLLDLKAQYATIRAEIWAALDRVIESQRFILGPEVEALEQEIASYSRCGYGIGTEIYYPLPMHLQESLAGSGYRKGDFPASEAASAQTLALPIYPELTEAMLARIVGVIAEFYETA